MNKLPKNLSEVIRQWDGHLTSELVLEPGEFGLGKVPSRLKPNATTTVVCGFCSTGCGLKVHLKDNEAINISADTKYPVNLGMACPKGWEALTPLKAKDRATTPYIVENGKARAISWDEALTKFTDKFKGIQEKYGKDSIAFISTGQIVTEEMVYLGALAKFGMGMIHGDGNTRQCMATSVVAYKQSFGFDAPPYSYQDFEESDTIVLVGSNICIAHPIMWERIKRNKNNPEIIVIDPRKTETAMQATQFYPIEPKSALIFFYALAKILIENKWIKQDYIDAHTNDFSDFIEFLKTIEIDDAVEKSAISLDELNKLAKTIADGKRVSFWWTMGVNQSHEGVRVAQAIINLALMTGNIGRPGTGANSITGQCNAMGSRLFSNTTGLLGGHDFTNEEHRTKVADILNIPVETIPSENSLAYDQIIDGISQDKIKGLWVIATNSAHSWINQNNFKDIIKNLEFFVVQEMYHSTETAQIADLVLPAAAWGEKDGTFINSERRIGLVKKVAKAPGKALSDFNIFKLIANYWGCDHLFKDWKTPEDVFQIMKKLSKDQPCDITGIKDYNFLEDRGGMQWPCKEGEVPEENQRILFEDGQYYHPDKKAKFIFEAPRKVLEKPSLAYPYWLLTGRGSSAQWHTQTRTDKSKVLKTLYPNEIYVEMNVGDARKLGIKSNEQVLIKSPRGHLKANVAVSYNIKEGQVFIPMHYRETNKLTFPAFDPYSRQPSYKACAVNIRRLEYWE